MRAYAKLYKLFVLACNICEKNVWSMKEKLVVTVVEYPCCLCQNSDFILLTK